MASKLYQRYQQWRGSGEVHGIDEDDKPKPLDFDSGNCGSKKKRSRSKIFYILSFTFLCCCLILLPRFVRSGLSASTPSIQYSIHEVESFPPESDVDTSICSSVPNGTICCNRSSVRTDICKMKGDIRTDSGSCSIFLYTSDDGEGNRVLQHEKIKPYTRKWESIAMDNVEELDLFVKNGNENERRCHVQHDVPAVFFSTGGFTGNAYHDINDGILPLYITSKHFNKKVVFVILNFHYWWFTKYANVLSQLSEFPVIDFSGENRTHCFPQAIVGLNFHDELSVDPNLMEGGETIIDFRNLLDRAYWPRIRGLIEEEKLNMNKTAFDGIKTPKLAIISRNGSRAITNEGLLAKEAEEIGFSVQVLSPGPTTELAKLYRELNSSDVMIGVHGAAMTYMLFVRPGSVFIQIIPVGLDWPSEAFYGEPAVGLGLKYMGYKILPRESSLYEIYSTDDPVLTNPETVNNKGWAYTKKTYLDHQTVKLDLSRFRKRLVNTYNYILNKNADLHGQSQ